MKYYFYYDITYFATGFFTFHNCIAGGRLFVPVFERPLTLRLTKVGIVAIFMKWETMFSRSVA